MCAAGYSAQPSDGAGSTNIDRRAQLRARLLDEGLGELIVADLGFSGGLIHDLSEGGMSLQLAGPMPPVPEFNVHFKLGYGASAIDAKARPVWRGGEGRIGICFAELSEEARDQLTHWLNGKRDIVQRETMTGEESALAAPTATLDDPSDRTEEKDRSLVSKLARAYSTLSSQQHAAALFPVGDRPFPNPRAGSALETAPEAEPPERDESSFEVLRKASEREVRRKKALDVVTGKRGGGESTVTCSDCAEANPRGHHFCGACGAQLEYGRLPQIRSSDTPTGVAATENSRPLPVIPLVASAPETEAAREQLIEPGTVGAIAAKAYKLTHADGAALVLAEGKKMLCKASIGKAPKVGEPMDVNAGLSGECMRTGQVVTCDDAGNDVRVPLSVSRDLGLQSIIIVPVRSQGQVVGLLEVTSGRKAAFSSVDVARLQGLAEEALSIAAPSLLQTPPLLDAAPHSGPMSIDGARNVEDTAGSKESIAPAGSKNDDNVTGHYDDAAITRESEHQESVEDLINKFRAASSRAVPDEPQPELVNIKDLRERSGSSLRPIPVFQSHSPKAGRLVAAFRQVPLGWSVLLLAGMVLVGAIAGWSLSVMKSPIDLVLTITPPSVADTMVQPIAAADASSSGIHRADGRVTLPQDVAAGQVISSPAPKYPEEAKKENISGTVSLMVSVDNAGFVDRVEVVSGNPILADAAVKAVKQWRYRHYLFGGQAVGTLARVSFLFTLPGR